jgi:chloride channel protein, CIC family
MAPQDFMQQQDSPIRGGTPRLVLIAAMLGAVSALAIWVFKRMIDAAEWLSHGWLAGSWPEVGLPWILVMPVVGGLVVGLILHLAGVPREPGHGVSEVIEAVKLGINEFPERSTPIKATTAALSLGSGAALGPEDPAVEIGGSLGHFVGRKGGLSHDSIQAMVAAGAAGGLTAAFHAPLVAIVFAVEVFALRLVGRATALVAVAAATSFLVMRLISPHVRPVVPALVPTTGWELPLCIGLGLLAGIMAAGQVRLMYTLEHAIIRWQTVPRWVKPAMGGLVLGCAGLAFPQLLGIGYDALEAIAAGDLPAWWILIALAVGKAILMAVSFGSGFLGGFFAPSLFIGAATGAAVGLGALALWPGLGSAPALFAAVGMAAFLAGAVRAPFAAALLIPALGGSYLLVPFLIVATQAAYWSSRALERHSLYTYGIAHPADDCRRTEGDPDSRTADP